MNKVPDFCTDTSYFGFVDEVSSFENSWSPAINVFEKKMSLSFDVDRPLKGLSIISAFRVLSSKAENSNSSFTVDILFREDRVDVEMVYDLFEGIAPVTADAASNFYLALEWFSVRVVSLRATLTGSGYFWIHKGSATHTNGEI